MGIILIQDNLRINATSDNWQVEEKKTVTSTKSKNIGAERWEVVTAGYCTNLKNALQRCLDFQLAELPDMEIKQFLKEAKMLQNKIIKYLEV